MWDVESLLHQSCKCLTEQYWKWNVGLCIIRINMNYAESITNDKDLAEYTNYN